MNFAAPENAGAPNICLTCDNKSTVKVKLLSVYSVMHYATEPYGQTDIQLQTSFTFSNCMSKGLYGMGISLPPATAFYLFSKQIKLLNFMRHAAQSLSSVPPLPNPHKIPCILKFYLYLKVNLSTGMW
jgi:hypothetical protein